MMKLLYIKNQYGGLGLGALITGGPTGADGTMAAAMAVMDTMVVDTAVEDIGLAAALGVVVEEVEIVEDLAVVVEADLEVVVEADLEEAAVAAAAEEVVVEVVDKSTKK
jgi:hypothetical protein